MILGSLFSLCCCEKEQKAKQTEFTKADSLTESYLALKDEFAYNTTLQKQADEIRASDQRVDNYREEYDFIASEYNRFISNFRSLTTVPIVSYPGHGHGF